MFEEILDSKKGSGYYFNSISNPEYEGDGFGGHDIDLWFDNQTHCLFHQKNLRVVCFII